ncbi:hypothetical protein ACFYOI_19605 [Streptomyces microflavus]
MQAILTVVPALDSDLEELAELAEKLQSYLLEAEPDLRDVRMVRDGHVPEGSKPGEVIAVGVLAVTLAPVVLRSVVRVLEVWIKNRPVRSVKVTVGKDTIELNATSDAIQQKAIDYFTAIHKSHDAE